LVKALKRRVGAHAVTLDTIEEIASYSLVKPRKIDFRELGVACKSASYKLREVKLEAKGEVVSVAGKDGRYLKLRGSGQLFRISGAHAPGKVEGLVGTITGWEKDGEPILFNPARLKPSGE
jgi:hypothetical protein|tara:strand:- start:196 stop:558 length:363 start_codon:yes stop_codon:yes gene_type:complete